MATSCLQRELMEKLSPKPDFLNKDSVYLYRGKAAATFLAKQNTDVSVYLFDNYLLLGKKNVVAIVKNLSKPPLKLLHLWSVKETIIRKGVKKSSLPSLFHVIHTSLTLPC